MLLLLASSRIWSNCKRCVWVVPAFATILRSLYSRVGRDVGDSDTTPDASRVTHSCTQSYDGMNPRNCPKKGVKNDLTWEREFTTQVAVPGKKTVLPQFGILRWPFSSRGTF